MLATNGSIPFFFFLFSWTAAFPIFPGYSINKSAEAKRRIMGAKQNVKGKSLRPPLGKNSTCTQHTRRQEDSQSANFSAFVATILATNIGSWLLYFPRPQRRAFAFPSIASSFSSYSVHSIHSLPIRFISLPFLFAFGFFIGQMNVFVWTLLQHCASSPPIQCGPTNSTNINEEGNAPNDGFGTIARLEASTTKIPLFFFVFFQSHSAFIHPFFLSSSPSPKKPPNFPLPPSPFVFFLFVWPLR